MFRAHQRATKWGDLEMQRQRLLIADDFEDTRFFAGQNSIPYDFSGAKFRDEIARLVPELDAVLAKDPEETLELAGAADFMAVDKMRRDVFDRAATLKWVHIAS